MKPLSWTTGLLGPLIGAGLTYALGAGVIPGEVGAWLVLAPWLAVQLQPMRWPRAVGTATLFGATLSGLVLQGAHHYGCGVFALGVMGMSSQYVVFGVGVRWLVQRWRRTAWLPLGLALLYVVLDVVYSRMTFMASVRLAGGLAFAPFWLPLAAVTGTAGLTFALVYVNAAAAQGLAAGWHGARLRWSDWRGRVLSVLGILALTGGWGWWGDGPVDAERGARSVFAVVQGCIGADEYREAYRNPLIRRVIWDRYTALTREAIAGGHGHVLWPEGALDVPLRKVEADLARFLRAHPCRLTAGFYEIEGTNRYNAVVSLDATGRVRDRYRKRLLIPLAEARHRRAERVNTVTLPEGTVATPICYEALFPHYVRALVNGGAQAIFMFTDESGLGRRATSMILLGQAVLRAVENRRYLVRVSQGGLSAVIDPGGRVLAQLAHDQRGILRAEVAWRADRSVYTRYGDWFVGLLVLAAPWIWRKGRGRAQSSPRGHDDYEGERLG